MTMRFNHARFIGPIAIIVGLLLLGLATVLYFGATRLDAEARERQETLVRRNVATWIFDTEVALTSWTIWDEAIEKLNNNFDLDWAERNLGKSILGTSSVRSLVVIDGSDKIIYAKTADDFSDHSFLKRGPDALLAAARPLLDLVRVHEHQPKKQGIPAKIAFSRMEVVGDDALLLTASLFQADIGTVVPTTSHAPILVSAIPIAGNLQTFFGERFMLDDATVEPAASVTPGRASVEIATAPNGQVQVLSWHADSPAHDLLRQSLPIAAVTLCIFVASCIFAILTSRQALKILLDAERRMRHAATHDFLTGLANRTLVSTEFSRLSQQGPLTIVCIDLDGFKAINDRFGHADGDDVLKQVAERLRAGCGKDDICFRLGGDEFAVMMPRVVEEQAEIRCKQIAALISKPYEVHGTIMTVGASYGISRVLNGETSPDTVFKRADEALYIAKRSNRAVASPFRNEVDLAASSS
ncbi:diguanylate cyclase [uncultured Agrobacterium sp.]|uniref:sensor domain-containing diguanylate cyclase n=1 Tax=uncultured Agrobacterium sp. TaxID=157277 RepID=UPI0025F68388|nr:diguanylate cyclase [uncultured Agrobacterium sp.]